jgi:hypothetical protein
MTKRIDLQLVTNDIPAHEPLPVSPKVAAFLDAVAQRTSDEFHRKIVNTCKCADPLPAIETVLYEHLENILDAT